MAKSVKIKISKFVMIENSNPHILYDLSIKDEKLRKEKAKRFTNANQVSEFLRVDINVVFNNRSIKNGKKPKPVKGFDGKLWGIRIGK